MTDNFEAFKYWAETKSLHVPYACEESLAHDDELVEEYIRFLTRKQNLRRKYDNA